MIVIQQAKDCLTDDRAREIYNATGQDPAASKVGRSPFAGNRRYYNMNEMRNRHGSFTFQDPEEIFRHFAAQSLFFGQIMMWH